VRPRQEILKWEARWSRPAGIAALLGVLALLVAGVAASAATGEGDAAALRAYHAHSGDEALSGALQAVGFALFAIPMFFLFRADQARSSRVRGQLIGLIVIAPLFLAVSSGLSVVARDEAANQFVAGKAESTLTAKEANEKCSTERKEKGAKSFGEEFEPSAGGTALAACEDRKVEDDEASNAISSASIAGATSGFGIAGGLGIAVAFFYTCLWAMRTGLLGRFWASLGMALGVTVLLGIILLPMIWFIYIGLLFLGWVPRGRPPAWAAGEAVPWPTPGEKAAESLEASEPPEEDEVPDTDPSALPPPNGNGSSNPSDSGPRKRKQRD
jgi:hypothetical protein